MTWKVKSSQKARAEQLAQMQTSLQAECQQFVADYVQAIRRKIDHFHAVNILGDGQTAAQLDQLKAQIAGVTGEDLTEQSKLAEKLAQACDALKAEVLDGVGVTALTGRLKRRVMLG